MTDIELFLPDGTPVARREIVETDEGRYLVEWIDPDDPAHVIAREADPEEEDDDDD